MKIVKYIAIIVLSIGLYFTWLQKEQLQNASLKFKEKTQELKQKILKLKNDLENSKEKDIIIINEDVIKEENIKIIILDNKKDYSKTILKVDFKDIDFQTSKDKQSNVKITPNITFDDNKNIDKVEVKIHTKF